MMGLLLGPIGITCATIIDKRVGFWSAFFGLVVNAFVVGLIVLIASTR